MPRRLAQAFRIAWPLVAVLVFLFDIGLFLVDRPLHHFYFKGELGVVELPTFVLLLATVPVAAWCALRSQGRERTFFALLALGCLYWGGEEVSWGQTFFHWGTPKGLFTGNYQKETNIHNTRGLVGTLLNQTPRFILNVLTILSVVLVLPGTASLERLIQRRIAPRWVDPLKALWLPALLSILSSLLAKWQGKPGYRGFGESQELFTAICLFGYCLIQSQTIQSSRTRSV